MESFRVGWESRGVLLGVTKSDVRPPSVAAVCKSEIRCQLDPPDDGYGQCHLRTDERLRISRTSHSAKIWSSISEGRSMSGFVV